MVHGATPAEKSFATPIAHKFQLKVSTCKSGLKTAQVVETSVANNSLSQDSNHPDDLFRSRYYYYYYYLLLLLLISIKKGEDYAKTFFYFLLFIFFLVVLLHFIYKNRDIYIVL